MRDSKVIWQQAIRDIRSEQAGIFVLVFIYGLIKSCRPYVYVLVPAWIVRELLNEGRLYMLASICVLGVISHTVLTFFEKVLFEKIIESRDRFNLLERNRVIQKLFNIPYEVLESGHCSLLISRQKEDMELHGGIYNRIIAFTEDAITYSFTFVISLFLLIPFFFSLSRYGAGFWIERPLFIVISLIILGLSSVLLSRQRIRVHKINEKDYEKYSEIYQEFEYYRDILSNYKYGKAIRIFGLDEFMINKGTKKLLSEGLRLNEKIAIREAKVETLGTLIYATFNAYFWLLVAAKTISGELALSSALI